MAESLLFTSLQVGRLTLKNRILLPGLTSNYAAEDGAVTDQLIAFHRERARGGAALLLVEGAFVDWSGKGTPRQLGLHDDRLIPGFARLAQAVHGEGALIGLQLVHTGRQMTSAFSGMQPVAPSPVACPVTGVPPRELSATEVREMVEQFARAACRARDAGFDLVEFHAAHGYLISEFLSAYSNFRTDEYGGDLEGRARFLREIIERSRQLLGRDYPLVCRINAVEYVQGGLTLEESVRLATWLQEWGCAAVDVSVGVRESYQYASVPAGEPVMDKAPLTQVIRSAVSIPVIMAGRILTSETAEAALQDGAADLVAMGRALIADPALPQKMSEGREADAVPCIGCNACNQRSRRPQIVCTVNSDVGREWVGEPLPAATPLKVAVVGSSLAGMEGARIAALRGHRVTILEPGPAPGGLMGWIRPRVPGMGEFALATGYFVRTLERLGVTVERNAPVRPETFAAGGYEAVLVAAAGAPSVDEAVQRWAGERAVLADQVFRGLPLPPGHVAVYGGGLLGCETALVLAQQGHPVTVVHPGDKLVADAHPSIRAFLLERLIRARVRLLTGETDPGRVRHDHLVLEHGYAPYPEWADACAHLPFRVEIIGDAYEASDMAERVWRAGEIARRL